MKIAMVSEHASPLEPEPARYDDPPGGDAPDAVAGPLTGIDGVAGADGVAGPDAAGQNGYVAALAAALAEQGHEVRVYTRWDSAERPQRVEVAGVTVEHVPAGPRRKVPPDASLRYVNGFGQYLDDAWRSEPPDVVHSHYWMSGLAALVGTRGLAIPVVHTYHALGAARRRRRGGRAHSGRIRMERAIGHDVDRVVAFSGHEVTELMRMGTSRGQIRVVPAGVDTDRFTPEGPCDPPPGDRPRVLTVGWLTEGGGVDTTIAALSRVPDAELLVAGGPPPARLAGDPRYRRLRWLADEVGVADRVRFLGYVPHERMPALIRSATVVACVPSVAAFSVVPLEAMACGVPVVASRDGGFLDTVVDGSTGTHVPPGRPDLLAGVLRTLLDDPFRCQGYGIAGTDRVRSRYTWDRVARDVAAVYDGVTPDAAGAGPDR